MNAREQLKRYPLTTITTAFAAGFATSSGLSAAAVAAAGALGKNPTVRRVALVAWPLVRANLSNHVKQSAKDFVKDAFQSARTKT